MPFTPTHLVAIVPIGRVSRGLLPWSALAIGAMIADWPLFCAFPVDYITTHSLLGLVTACLPLGLACDLLFQGMMKRPLAELLPQRLRSRVTGLAAAKADLSPSGVIKAALAIVIGAATHLAWDSFTHHDRWGTRAIPGLESPLLTVNGSAVPGYKVLQYGSTIVGLPLLVCWLIRWLGSRPPERSLDEPAPAHWRSLVAGLLVLLIPMGVILVEATGGRGSYYERAGRAITTSGRMLFLGALAYSLVDGITRIWSPRRIVVGAWRLLASGLTLLAFSSFFAYTTIGLDFESPSPTGVDVLYLRLRWDDGSTWAGSAVQPYPPPGHELDWFDPGGTLGDRPTRPIHRSRWNDLGFWRVDGPDNDPYLALRYPGASASQWWGCPSWLLVIGLWPRFFGGLIRRRSGDWLSKTVFRDRASP